jgi:hypothetical protein
MVLSMFPSMLGAKVWQGLTPLPFLYMLYESLLYGSVEGFGK